MKRFNYVFVLLLISLAGCATASTSVTSYKDPDYEQKEFKKVLITVNTKDLEEKFAIETRLVKDLALAGVSAVEGNKLFPPTRSFTDEEKTASMLENEIDAFIVITPEEFGVKENYVPVSESKKYVDGEFVKTYEGGYKEDKPWAEYETALFDVSNGKKVWMATSSTQGNADAHKSDIINSFCYKMIHKLLSDKLLIKTVK
ncbi:MAG TPA: hypothetical protein VHO28_10600 [Ignavibacteriales bacterium]|nr:hypothetical protein [Ignavibacteriales bacterium]